MNLTQDKRKFQILMVIGAAILLFTFIVLLYAFTVGQRKKPSTIPSITPNTIIPPQVNPEQLEPNVKEIRQKIINAQIKNDNGNFLLSQSGNLKIEYIPTPDYFQVTINQEPVNEAKQEAQNWFLAFGLKQSDLCDLSVRFGLGDRQLFQSNPNFSSLPDGCAEQP